MPERITDTYRSLHFPRRRPIAFIDLDGTIYPGLLMEDLVNEQVKLGLISSVEITAIEGEIRSYRNGQKGHSSNVKALNELWSSECKGKRYKDLFEHAAAFVAKNKDKFAPFAQPVFDILKGRGYEIWLITGEPVFAARAVVKEFGGNGFLATDWKTSWEETEEGRQLLFTGFSERPMTVTRKGEWAERFFEGGPHRLPNNREESIALIDSTNDIDLARSVRWSIVCGDDPSPELVSYLESSGKEFFIACDREVIEVVGRLTSEKVKV